MTYATESYRDMANSGLFVIAAISGTSSDSCTLMANHLILLLPCLVFTNVLLIVGNSPAGGCLIAMTADYKAMAKGKYGIGLNEVAVLFTPFYHSRHANSFH